MCNVEINIVVNANYKTYIKAQISIKLSNGHIIIKLKAALSRGDLCCVICLK